MASPARTVLVIEDNDDARDALAALLELEGCTVETAADGVSGIEIVRAKRPDVALVDIGLPGIDGYEVARRIRDLGAPQPYMVALTGYSRQEDRDRATDAGFDAHLVKPVDMDQLEHLLSTLSSDLRN